MIRPAIEEAYCPGCEDWVPAAEVQTCPRCRGEVCPEHLGEHDDGPRRCRAAKQGGGR